jgi:poly-gamma-glutamate capsule biosynthesis protein CapA/YwtB (metallophosphatase superfamily)
MNLKNNTLKISFIGDIMIFGKALDTYQKEGKRAIKDKVYAPIFDSDIVVANLETPITSKKNPVENKYYNLKTSKKITELFDRRFVFCLANNHILDYGEDGLRDTIHCLNAKNLKHCGAGSNLNEAIKPSVFEIKGTRIGIICAGDQRFKAATDVTAGIFPAVTDLLKANIRILKKEVDIIVVSIHAGIEFLPIPSPKQNMIAKMCFDENVDAVSFHHAHCISGFKKDHKSTVLFGTGKYVFPNVISGKKLRIMKCAQWRVRESAAWHILFNLNPKKIDSVSVTPIFLGDDGFPEPANQHQSQKILEKINVYSKRIKNWNISPIWYFLEMMKFDYLWLNLVPYVDIARRKGFIFMINSLFKGIRSQLMK